MTEKEKQQAGELYNSNNPELVKERITAKKLCIEYNTATYNDFQKKTRLLDRLLALRGENTVIEPEFYCDYGYNIVIGDNFYVNHNCVILDCAEVVFGDNVFIGPNCGFYTAGHPLDAETRNQGLEYAKPIKVGSNVWIGGNVCVMPGVTIGDNVVIGGGSVVVHDIPSGYVAAGNPCKVLHPVDGAAVPEKKAEAQETVEAEKPAEPEKPAEAAPADEVKPAEKHQESAKKSVRRPITPSRSKNPRGR